METEKAEKIIANLSARGGFDGWWDDIDQETKSEILDEIQEVIDEE